MLFFSWLNQHGSIVPVTTVVMPLMTVVTENRYRVPLVVAAPWWLTRYGLLLSTRSL